MLYRKDVFAVFVYISIFGIRTKIFKNISANAYTLLSIAFYNKNHENQFHTFTRPQTISIQHDAGETVVSPQFHSLSSMTPILGTGLGKRWSFSE